MDKLKYIKLENEDGSYSDSIPLAVDSDHVDVKGNTLTEELENKSNKDEVEFNFKKIQSEISGLASGSPLSASSISEMTNTSKIYVNTSDGYWYYYNGTNWLQGGQYLSNGITDGSVEYKGFNDYIKTQLGYHIPTYTLTSGYYYNIGGGITQYPGYSYSSPIHLLKNERIVFKAKGYQTNITMIAVCNENNTSRTPVTRCRSSEIEIYEYTAVEDTYVTLCAYTDFFVNVEINSMFLRDVIFPEKNYSIIGNIADYIIYDGSTDFIKDYYEGKYVNYKNGSLGNLGGIYSSKYMYIPYVAAENQILTMKRNYPWTSVAPDLVGMAFYNKDYNFISGFQYPQNENELNIPIPDGACYLRFSIRGHWNDISDIKIYTDLNKIDLLFSTFATSGDIADLNNKISSITSDDEEDMSYPLQKINRDGGFMKIFTKIACIGDSLTAGQFESHYTDGSGKHTVYNTMSNYGYPKHLERLLECEVKSYASGGQTTKSWNNSSFSDQVLDPNNAAECYIICLGTNDIGYDGSFSGDVSTDIDLEDYTNNADTSVGNYAKIIQKIKIVQPRARIFCSAIPHTRNTLSTRTEANEKIEAITKLFDSCWFLDFANYGVQPADVPTWKSKYYMGGHMNSLGYLEWAYMISSYITWIILHNANNFKDIPFIGTDLYF